VARSAITVQQSREGVAVVSIDRPPANALTTETVTQLREILDGFAPEGRAVVMKSDNPRFFCAGGDINDFATMDGDQLDERMTRFHEWLIRLETYPGPLVVAINGIAVGAGCEMLLYADRVVSGSATRIGFPEVRNGVLPAAKGIYDLQCAVGYLRARKIMLSGELLHVIQARDLGLVDEVVPEEELVDTAIQCAGEYAARPAVLHAAIKAQARPGRRATNDELLAESLERMHAYRNDPATQQARSRWRGDPTGSRKER